MSLHSNSQPNTPTTKPNANSNSWMQGENWIYQRELFPIVDGNGYKLAKIYMMQCYSAKETAYDYGIEGESKEPIFTNYNKEWSKRAIYFRGYFDLNVFGFDVR